MRTEYISPQNNHLLRPVKLVREIPSVELMPSWANTFFVGSLLEIINSPNLIAVRQSAIEILLDVENNEIFSRFSADNGEYYSAVAQTQVGRALRLFANHAGLLTIQELNQIKDLAPDWVNDHREKLLYDHFQLPMPQLNDFAHVASITQNLSSQGKMVGFIGGSFDPPHVGHLAAMLYSHMNCDYLVVGFDSNNQIRHRKNREPRIRRIDDRRVLLGSFPWIDQTVELRPEIVSPTLWFEDYQELGINRMFTYSQDPSIEQKRKYMERLGGDVVIIDTPLDDFFPSSTSAQARWQEITMSIHNR